MKWMNLLKLELICSYQMNGWICGLVKVMVGCRVIELDGAKAKVVCEDG